jgi:two-component system, sensor histidine kinase and response regulator
VIQVAEFTSVLSDWSDQIATSFVNNKSLYLAVFSEKNEFVFANDTIATVFNENSDYEIILPAIEDLLKLENSKPLIFEGTIKLIDRNSNIILLDGQVYRKTGRLLVVGVPEKIADSANIHQRNNNLDRGIVNRQDTKQTLQELNQVNSKLEKLNRNKEYFLSALNNDLKNSFYGLLDLSGLLTENIREYDFNEIEHKVKQISRTAENSYFFLSDLLSWTNMVEDKVQFNPANHSFVEICRNIIEIVHKNTVAENIRIGYFAEYGLTLFADIDLLNIIFRNLISRSIKFTDRGGKIDIFAISEKDHVEVTVSSSGNCSEVNEIMKIFEDDSSGSKPGIADHNCTEVGLILCREFVRKHNGTIRIANQAENGTMFIFTLPYSNKQVSI